MHIVKIINNETDLACVLDRPTRISSWLYNDNHETKDVLSFIDNKGRSYSWRDLNAKNVVCENLFIFNDNPYFFAIPETYYEMLKCFKLISMSTQFKFKYTKNIDLPLKLIDDSENIFISILDYLFDNKFETEFCHKKGSKIFMLNVNHLECVFAFDEKKFNTLMAKSRFLGEKVELQGCERIT